MEALNSCPIVVEWFEKHSGSITAVATAFIAWFTIALSISTKRLWVEAKRASEIALRSSQTAEMMAKTAKDEFTSTHRPWISADVKIASPLTYCEEDGWHIAIEYCLKNVGSGPSVSTEALATLIPNVLNSWSLESLKGRLITEMPTLGTDTVTELQRLCDQAMHSGREKVGFGKTLFPSEEVRRPSGIYCKSPLFDKAKELDNYSGQFHLIFCARYGFTFDETQHVTAKAFVLFKRDGSKINLSGENIGMENLWLSPVPDTKTDYAT